MRKITSGFTIVELLVITAVIGILATLSVIGFTRYQSDARDSQRLSKSTILSEALEKYYDKNGEYPGCTALSGAATTVTTNVLPGVELNTLLTPKNVAGDTNSIECTDITGAAGETDVFAYIGDGSAACSSGATCSEWTLKYKEEGTGAIKFIDSRHNATAVAVGDVTNLVATPFSFTQINLSWTAVAGIVDYTIQRATNSGFSTNLVESNPAGNSSSATGLTAGTVYYFRVRANDALSSGNWSNVVNATTSQLATPVAVATVNSNAQITLSWNAIALAQSYTIEHSAASTFTTPTTITGITTLNQAITTGLVSGTTRYFRVKAIATADTSNWSATVSAAPTVNPPATPTTTAAMSGTNAVGTASAVTCAAGTTTEYQLQYRSTATATAGAWSAWSVWSTTRTMTVGALQGYQYTFESHARCQAVSTASAATATSAIATVVRPITAPALPVVTASTSGTMTTFTWPAVACPAGTSIRYNYDYNNDAGYDSGWVANTTRSVPVTSSTEGYQYVLLVRAQCYNTYATSAWGATDTASYIRPVQMPDAITFSITRLASNQVSLRALSACNSGAVVMTTGDPAIYSPYVWLDTSAAGWWNTSHNSVWLSPWNNYVTPFAINPIHPSGTFAVGSDWKLAVRMSCKNLTTGRASSSTATTYSILMQAP